MNSIGRVTVGWVIKPRGDARYIGNLQLGKDMLVQSLEDARIYRTKKAAKHAASSPYWPWRGTMALVAVRLVRKVRTA